jgi:ABC-type antimicrobial peptide transport system permease subunit
MMSHVLALVVAGGVLGVAASSGVSRFLQKVLFRVEPLDAATMVAAPLLMILIAALACSVPSWRAAQSDPSAVLRTE